MRLPPPSSLAYPRPVTTQSLRRPFGDLEVVEPRMKKWLVYRNHVIIGKIFQPRVGGLFSVHVRKDKGFALPVKCFTRTAVYQLFQEKPSVQEKNTVSTGA